MRELFNNSSRERRREEKAEKGEELRVGICIVSSFESSKWWLFSNVFFSRTRLRRRTREGTSFEKLEWHLKRHEKKFKMRMRE